MESSSWICPNDRHLSLRAKLRSGWSVRTGQGGRKGQSKLNEEELQQIQNVISRASMLENMEQERIGSLVHRLNIMQQNSMGNGQTSCILCGEQFRKFSGNTPIICTDCKRKVCHKCSVDCGTNAKLLPIKTNQQVLTQNYMCKLCSENRELWKRSGAWFFHAIPVHKLPAEETATSRQQTFDHSDSIKYRKIASLAPPDSPAFVRSHSRTLSGGSVGSYQWAKSAKLCTPSASSSGEDSSDDGITLGKANKLKGLHSGVSMDTASLASTPSTNADHISVSSSSPAGFSNKGSNRSSFRSVGSRHSSIRRRQKQQYMHHSTDDDSISIDSRSTEMSVDDMSTLHGGVNNIPILKTEEASSADDKENNGYLEFSLLYDPLKSALHVNIIKGKNLCPKDSNGLSDPYVKLHLLPGFSKDSDQEVSDEFASLIYGKTGTQTDLLTQATKLRTKTISKTLNPEFNETLVYWGIGEEELSTRKLQLTVLDEDRFSKNDFLGEVIIPLDEIVPTEKKFHDVPLKGMHILSSGDKMTKDPGRIHVGLRFNTNEHCLVITIYRCANLIRNPTDNVNPFVKVSLALDNDKTMVQKTEIKKKNPNPEFNQEIKFKVPPENGHAVVARGSLHISVFHKDALGQQLIGTMSLGVSSEGEKLRHWFNCLKHPNQQFDNWHTLLSESPKKFKQRSPASGSSRKKKKDGRKA